MTLASYILRRLGQAVVVLAVAYLGTFVLLTVLPSDPISLKIYGGEDAGALTDEQIRQLQAFYGFDKPVPVQFFDRVVDLLHGDLGYSLVSGSVVSERIAEVIPYTAALAGVAVITAGIVVVGVTWASQRPVGGFLRPIGRSTPPILSAVPSFWLGLLALQIFSFRLGILPIVGGTNPVTLIVGGVVLGIHVSAHVSQIVNQTVDSLLRQPFVDYLRVIHTPSRDLARKHLWRNTAASGSTVAGLTVAGLLTGSVLIETIFNIPGLGKLLQVSVEAQDLSMVQGIVIVVATVFVAINFIVDTIQVVVDPRLAAKSSGGTA